MVGRTRIPPISQANHSQAIRTKTIVISHQLPVPLEINYEKAKSPLLVL